MRSRACWPDVHLKRHEPHFLRPQAFETHCRAQGGFAGLLDVRQVPAARDRKQQSFFLAETLKYLYLLFADSDALDLDEWVRWRRRTVCGLVFGTSLV